LAGATGSGAGISDRVLPCERRARGFSLRAGEASATPEASRAMCCVEVDVSVGFAAALVLAKSGRGFYDYYSS
jgi:hypothetical protein